MIDNPCLQISATRSGRWEISGPSNERAAQIVSALWNDSDRLANPLSIRIEKAPPVHAGFGSGTQLTMGIAAILSKFIEDENENMCDLATKLGRGARSLVGSNGFNSGGLILDRGQCDMSCDGNSRESETHTMPEMWRWLTLYCNTQQGKSGDEERNAFARSKPDPESRQELLAFIETDLLPSIASQDFYRFSHALGKYSERCGEIFADQQGGLYGSPFAEEAAAHLSRAGIVGFGQSSWGPTVFALFPDAGAAATFVETNHWLQNPDIRYCVSRSNNIGARISWEIDKRE
ncbi:MAG: hypothetical protein VXZ84_02650 [Planctomycetota bacterium]|nr:hypothetical protein [Planctomycetota bacterium]